MNREILFRGKRLDNGEWVYGFYVYCRKHHYILPIYVSEFGERWHDERWQDWVEVDPETVGQYCPELDQFKGDICKNEDQIGVLEHGKHPNPGHESYEIGWNIDWISRGLNKWYRKDAWFWCYEEKTKWIGNIHDNPELLGGNG